MHQILGVLQKALDLAHSVTGDDNAGHGFRTQRAGHIRPRQTVAVCCHSSEHILLAVHENAVEVIAGFLGGNGKLHALNQPLHILRSQSKLGWQLIGRNIREISFRQGLQLELGLTRRHTDQWAVLVSLQGDLAAFRQFAHNVIKKMGGHSDGPFFLHLPFHSFGHVHIKVSGLEGDELGFGTDQHIGENRDGVAPFHNPVHVCQSRQKDRAFKCDFHDANIYYCCLCWAHEPVWK